jgi:HEAT repeat protein
MKTLILCLLPALASAQHLDANSCFQARGKSDDATIEQMTRALEDPDLFTCAATNLRIAGAVGPLRHALAGSENPQVRAAAARELGAFQKPELLEPLSRAAEDENALVATNALAGLSNYRDAAVVPYLAALGKKGGIVGDMAVDRLLEIDPAAAVLVARLLLDSPQVPDRLYAMRVIGAAGDNSDLPALRKIAATPGENLAQRNRGFGLMPPINLARAAQSAIAAIEAK